MYMHWKIWKMQHINTIATFFIQNGSSYIIICRIVCSYCYDAQVDIIMEILAYIIFTYYIDIYWHNYVIYGRGCCSTICNKCDCFELI